MTDTPPADRVIFLPGASGDGRFWAPVAAWLPYPLDSRFGARDWRDEYKDAYPAAPRWFIDDRTDLTPLIPSIHNPTLLIWGDADPTSPVAVGEYLARLLPRSRLVVISAGEHMLGRDRADDVAPVVANHLAS